MTYYTSQARIQKFGLEGVECRKHSNGGAEGADGGEVWGGVSPTQWGLGLGRRLSPENFGMFSFEIVHFDAFWSTSKTKYNCHYDVQDISRGPIKS